MNKERPILFSGPMVRAIIDGRKTQTRRIIKQPPRKDGAKLLPELLADPSIGVGKACPYGAVGDRLWVRETWCHAADDDDRMKYNAEGNLDSSCCHYRADGYEVLHVDGAETKSGLPKSPWIPSIHMPRWASRITLEITGLRVERLNEISEEDAIAEGCEGVCHCGDSYARHAPYDNHGAVAMKQPSEDFQELWESINGAGSWAANPWVWVIEFKRIDA